MCTECYHDFNPISPINMCDQSRVKWQDVELAMNDREEASDGQARMEDSESPDINDEDFNYKASMRPARNPSQPSVKEREDHESLHFPYRVWCPHCVRGRGVSSHHVMRKEGPDEKDQRVPVIGMDYAFLGNDDETRLIQSS